MNEGARVYNMSLARTKSGHLIHDQVLGTEDKQTCLKPKRSYDPIVRWRMVGVHFPAGNTYVQGAVSFHQRVEDLPGDKVLVTGNSHIDEDIKFTF